jgi:hypothetical protein
MKLLYNKIQDLGVPVALLYSSYKSRTGWAESMHAGIPGANMSITKENGLTCVVLLIVATIKRKKSKRHCRYIDSGHGEAAQQSSWRRKSTGKQTGCLTALAPQWRKAEAIAANLGHPIARPGQGCSHTSWVSVWAPGRHETEIMNKWLSTYMKNRNWSRRGPKLKISKSASNAFELRLKIASPTRQISD